MANRPSAVAFDVVETLMSLQPLAARVVDVNQPASALPGWFARPLRYGVGLSAVADYVPFEEASAETLRAISDYSSMRQQSSTCSPGSRNSPHTRCRTRHAGARRGRGTQDLLDERVGTDHLGVPATHRAGGLHRARGQPRRSEELEAAGPRLSPWTYSACPDPRWRWSRCMPGIATAPSGRG